MKLTIYHNPRCSKSRATLAIIESTQNTLEVIEYLKQPLSETEIKLLLKQLQLAPIQMIRTKEKAFTELGLTKNSDEQALITAMATHPILIERPIVSNGKTAVIGRPPENVLSLIQ